LIPDEAFDLETVGIEVNDSVSADPRAVAKDCGKDL
jgi:hypothetical protein